AASRASWTASTTTCRSRRSTWSAPSTKRSRRPARSPDEEKPIMSTTIRCDIVSAEQEIFHGEATLVVATGELGELGIAPRHAPLITRLKPGKVVVTQADGSQ